MPECRKGSPCRHATGSVLHLLAGTTGTGSARVPHRPQRRRAARRWRCRSRQRTRTGCGQCRFSLRQTQQNPIFGTPYCINSAAASRRSHRRRPPPPRPSIGRGVTNVHERSAVANRPLRRPCVLLSLSCLSGRSTIPLPCIPVAGGARRPPRQSTRNSQRRVCRVSAREACPARPTRGVTGPARATPAPPLQEHHLGDVLTFGAGRVAASHHWNLMRQVRASEGSCPAGEGKDMEKCGAQRRRSRRKISTHTYGVAGAAPGQNNGSTGQ
eukprot:gene5264-biopygen4182